MYGYVPDSNTLVDQFGLYAGEGVRDLGKYHSFFDAYLPEDIWNATDGKHFREANKQLYEAMQNDPNLKKNIMKRYPDVFDHVQPGPRGGYASDSPPGVTWHHNNRPGKLELVDRADHKKFHKIYHPDGSGGKKKWGGGRKNKFKRKPKMH
ncbi:hypothetical protein CL8139_630001 [Cellulophaga lytica]|nr:hypothetical protein CL8139_630001 [Cellulophaga lytica]